MASTLYLETYVEGTSSFPTELQRLLTTIKALDERSAILLEQVREASQAIVEMPPPTTRKIREEQAAEIRSLQERVQADEAMLMQFMEEKCQLAQQCHDLLDMHSQELDQVLEMFESEMAGAQQPAAPAPGEYNPFEYGGGAGGGGGGRRGKQYNDQWDSLEPLPAPTLKRHAQPAQGMPNKGKRQREELPPPHPSRAANTAAATAAVLAEQDPYAPLPPGPGSGSLPGLSGTLGGGLGALGGPLDGPPDGVPSIPPAVTMSFMHNEKTAGLRDSAPQPQLPGRLLTLADITPDLAGRQAEMFWPDDNMWYLIEIHVVDVETRRATIVYRTGEVEDLDLQEIAQEAHMSLISDV